MVESTQQLKDTDVEMVRDFQNFVDVGKTPPAPTTEATPLLNENRERDEKLSWKVENAKREMQYLGVYPEETNIEHDQTGWDQVTTRRNVPSSKKFHLRGQEQQEQQQQQEQQEQGEQSSESVPETLQHYMDQTRQFAQSRAMQIGESMGLVEPESEKENKQQQEPRKTAEESGEHKESLVKQTVGVVKEFITGFVETVAHGGTDDE